MLDLQKFGIPKEKLDQIERQNLMEDPHKIEIQTGTQRKEQELRLIEEELLLMKERLMEQKSERLKRAEALQRKDEEQQLKQQQFEEEARLQRKEAMKNDEDEEKACLSKNTIAVNNPSNFNGALLRTLQGHTAYINCICMSPGGSKIVAGSADSTIKGHTTIINLNLKLLLLIIIKFETYGLLFGSM